MAAVFCNRFQTWSKMWHAARAHSAGSLRLCAVWWTTRMWLMRTGGPACNDLKVVFLSRLCPFENCQTIIPPCSPVESSVCPQEMLHVWCPTCRSLLKCGACYFALSSTSRARHKRYGPLVVTWGRHGSEVVVKASWVLLDS